MGQSCRKCCLVGYLYQTQCCLSRAMQPCMTERHVIIVKMLPSVISDATTT
jgi:hypothetical protein